MEHDKYPSCVVVIEATQLVQLYQQYRDSLFTLNIRNYLGSTATNRLLMASLREEPANFYYYNNGIACLAKHLEVSADRVVATGLQVINGAQTVRSLARAARGPHGSESVRGALVLVRITRAATQYGAEGRFRDHIVRYNNTQNVIKVSDFRSNDPVHADLKKRFAEQRWKGKRVVYVPKRTDPTVHRGDVTIPVEEFAKVVYSFLQDPIAFSSRSSFLFDDGDTGGYRVVFGDGYEVWTTIPDSGFRLRSAIWWMSTIFGEQLCADKRATEDNVVKAALERKWMLLFVARLVLERSYDGDGYKAEIQKTYKGDWEYDEGTVGRWVAQLYTNAKQILIWNYREATLRPGFIHRNWMRDENTIQSLQRYIKRAPIPSVRRD